ncbi:SGNH/GDSL hydrolase family protein [Planctomycetes bacterium TBK1r]|uniref:Phosphatidylcholine-sterol acyltransferase n=1 Tax=Stieleria magnilauensis TaxID=2527963 RepID=A0ABX5XSI4_9BACT|nr:Phosphatidylcholine-sterol acyltransferase precursor [Planctomycetes bacterium TBK1r]
MFRTTRIVLLAAAVFVVTAAGQLHAQYSRVVVFGDSLCDTGNSFAATGIPPAPYYSEGRFSNGPIWIDFLQQQMGLSDAQLLNFAVGGSSTGFGFKEPPEGIFETPPGTLIPTVGEQIGIYQLVSGGVSDPDQLTILWAGSNDLFTYNLPASVVNNIEQHVRDLAATGADEFLIPGISPIGSTPSLRWTFEGFILNYFARQTNRKLNRRLNALEDELGITIHRLDTYTLTVLATLFPSHFGLTNTTNSALDDIADGLITPAEGATYLYWDIIHPTSIVHQTLAAAAIDVLTD